MFRPEKTFDGRAARLNLILFYIFPLVRSRCSEILALDQLF